MKTVFALLIIIFLFVSTLSAAAESKKPIPKNPIGKWQLDTTSDPMDDSKTYFLFLTADKGTNQWGKPITFVIRCKNETPAIYIIWGEYLGEDNVYVSTRFDKEEFHQSAWAPSTDGTTAFYQDDVDELIDKLKKANKFAAQVTPYHESPRTVIFDVRYFKNVVRHFYKGCPAPKITIPPDPAALIRQAIEYCKTQMTEYIAEHGSPDSKTGDINKGEEVWIYKSNNQKITFYPHEPMREGGEGYCDITKN